MSTVRRRVYVNVYDMMAQNWLLHPLGLGVYHSSVGIEGHHNEYCFGGHEFPGLTGVFEMPAGEAVAGVVFRQKIFVGVSDRTDEELNALLDNLRGQFTGTSYNLLSKNCNHFTEAACVALTGCAPPSWINRIAGVVKMVPCIVPEMETPSEDVALAVSHSRGASTATNATAHTIAQQQPLLQTHRRRQSVEVEGAS
ncbi:hypothetical protein RI367_001426 [Sorochytrium milnesiophthora]